MPRWPDFLRVAMMAGVILAAAFSFSSFTGRIKIDRNDYIYGLYLYHMLVISTLIGLGSIGRWWLWPSFMLAVSIWRGRHGF
jgi:hypothetical protein